MKLSVLFGGLVGVSLLVYLVLKKSKSKVVVDVFSKSGQEHLFRYWEKLSHEEREELIRDCREISIETVEKLKDELKKNSHGDGDEQLSKIEEFQGVFDVSGGDKEKQRSAFYKDGLDLVGNGKCAALLMAGGQGTRLGSDDPKGMFNIGLPSGKSLFQIQAERIIRLGKVASQANGGKKVVIPWYIMTSPATHARTVEFFEKNAYFSLSKKDVFFFQQAVVPCLTKEGKIILEEKSKISKSPNGNGGIYEALNDSGALADMKKRNVEFIFTYSVDNVLVQVCDPEFIGYCHMNKIDFGNKVLEKRDPHEAVGVLARKNGKPCVVEYSELSKEMAERKAENGKLVFGAANIAIHCFTRQFLESVARNPIPYHLANKKIPHVSEDGMSTIKPKENNGVKFEKFIFDSLSYAKNPGAYMVKREGTFSPVKNASGTDSPATARSDLSTYHASLILEAGGKIQGEGLCEISPLVSFSGEGLAEVVKGKTFNLPVHLK